FTARPDGWCDYTSPRFAAFTGLPPGAWEGFGWVTALHPDDGERTRSQWLACVRENRPFEIEYRFPAAAGGYRWFLRRAVPLPDEHGHVTRWVGACIDIDDRKRAEEALKEADRRKNEFLAVLGHELRNPLAPIRNAAHVLRSLDLGEPRLT